MPAVNSKILTADYNDIRNKVVSVLGTGAGNFGWGQASKINSSAVSEGNKVTVNEWTNLRFDIINAYRHVYGSNPTMAQPVAGNTIRYSTTFTPDTGTLDTPQKQYDDWINNVTTNRFTVAAGESATTSAISVSKTDAWNGNISCTIGFYFNSANEARWFFNSGGQIRISASRSGGTTTPQNTSWTSLLNAIGTQSFGANNPGTGTTPSDGLNWYRCTNSFQTYYTGTASSPYGSNNYQLQARVTDVTNNSTGTAAYGEIRVLFNDGYVDPALVAVGRPFAPDYDEYGNTDLVDGTLTVSVSTVYATGIMVPNNASFTVSQPTIGVGSISSAYTAPALATLTPPSLWFDSLSTYMRAYLSEFRNPSFYFYSLDGEGFAGTFYDEYIVDGVDRTGAGSQGTYMFDEGNFTLPVAGSGATVTSSYFNKSSLSPGTPFGPNVIKYEAGKSLYIVDTDAYIKTSGYRDPNAPQGSSYAGYGSAGGPESRPLTAMMFRPGTNVWHGWQKIGTNDVRNNAGSRASGYIYENTTYNGFTVIAWYNQTWGGQYTVSSSWGGSFTSRDAAVCDLHITLGHPRWGSSVQSYNVYSYAASNSTTRYQNNHLAVNGTNLFSSVLLLSKVYPNNVTDAEMTTIVNAWVNRVAAYFNF